MAARMRRGKAIEWMERGKGRVPARARPPVRGRERGEAVGSEEAVMGESIGVEWIHLPFYEAIRSGRGRSVRGQGRGAQE